MQVWERILQGRWWRTCPDSVPWVELTPQAVRLVFLLQIFLLEELTVRNNETSFLLSVSNNRQKSLPSVQFSHSVVSDSLRPHELKHARPRCPWPTPRVHPNSYPSSRWCHPAISSSVAPFSSCPQSLSASGSFPMSQLFTSGGQSIGVSASASVLPLNIQGWFGKPNTYGVKSF